MLPYKYIDVKNTTMKERHRILHFLLARGYVIPNNTIMWDQNIEDFIYFNLATPPEQCLGCTSIPRTESIITYKKFIKQYYTPFKEL